MTNAPPRGGGALGTTTGQEVESSVPDPPDISGEAAPCMVGFAQVPAELLEAPVKAGRDSNDRRNISMLAVLLWAVLDVHQRDKGHSWPNYAHLAEHLGCSRRSVIRAADELENAGWLTREHGGGRGKVNRYVLLRRPGVVHSGDTSVTVSNGKGDTSVTPGGDTSVTPKQR